MLWKSLKPSASSHHVLLKPLVTCGMWKSLCAVPHLLFSWFCSIEWVFFIYARLFIDCLHSFIRAFTQFKETPFGLQHLDFNISLANYLTLSFSLPEIISTRNNSTGIRQHGECSCSPVIHSGIVSLSSFFFSLFLVFF